jgi:hypothetical protein
LESEMEISIKDQTVLIDECDVDLVLNHACRLHTGYVRLKLSKHQEVFLHRMIAQRIYGDIEGRQIDHKNRVKLDNRRENLRIATHAQNLWNREPYLSNTSGFKGVSNPNVVGKFRAEIQYSGKGRHLGCYETAVEAALAYNVAAVKYFGDFAYQNPIDLDAETYKKYLDRVTTQVEALAQNIRSRPPHIRSSTGFRGVSFDKNTGKFKAAIKANGKQVTIGRYPTAIDAAKAYNSAVVLHFGESAWLNPV